MYLKDILRQTIFSLWTHKLRTCLALFGIVWGTIAIIMLQAFNNGFYSANMKNLAFLNNGTILAWSGSTSKPFAGLPQGQKIHIRIRDLENIIEHIPDVEIFSPALFTSKDFVYQNKNTRGGIEGVSADYLEIQQLRPFPGGRFINPLDIKNKNRVVFIDNEIKKALFGEKEAVGKLLNIQGIPFTVVGVSDPKHKNIVMWMTNVAYIPYTTFLSLWGDQDVDNFFIQPHHANQTLSVKNSLKNMLGMKYKFDPNDKQAVMIPDTQDAQTFFKWFFRAIELFLGFCGILTLSVGALGIANMMFLIVTERTREIGLRIALGAQQFHIMSQFILETLLLVFLGGVIGFVISFACINLLQSLSLPEWLGKPHISWLSATLTIIMLCLAGLVAGYFPARRAANMEPIQALAF